MRIDEFHVLYAIHKQDGSFSKETLAEKTGYELSKVDSIIEKLKNKKWLDGGITEAG